MSEENKPESGEKDREKQAVYSTSLASRPSPSEYGDRAPMYLGAAVPNGAGNLSHTEYK